MHCTSLFWSPSSKHKSENEKEDIIFTYVDTMFMAKLKAGNSKLDCLLIVQKKKWKIRSSYNWPAG